MYLYQARKQVEEVFDGLAIDIPPTFPPNHYND